MILIVSTYKLIFTYIYMVFYQPYGMFHEVLNTLIFPVKYLERLSIT